MQRRQSDLRLFDFRLPRAILLSVVFGLLTTSVIAQEPPAVQPKETQKQPPPNKEELSPAPAKVDVQPVARDDEIRKRLQDVLDATGWFVEPRVEEGVVFLSGRTTRTNSRSGPVDGEATRQRDCQVQSAEFEQYLPTD